MAFFGLTSEEISEHFWNVMRTGTEGQKEAMLSYAAALEYASNEKVVPSPFSEEGKKLIESFSSEKDNPKNEKQTMEIFEVASKETCEEFWSIMKTGTKEQKEEMLKYAARLEEFFGERIVPSPFSEEGKKLIESFSSEKDNSKEVVNTPPAAITHPMEYDSNGRPVDPEYTERQANDPAQVKFSSLVEDVKRTMQSSGNGPNIPLAFIYDYSALNDFGKTIFRNTSVNFRFKRNVVYNGGMNGLLMRANVFNEEHSLKSLEDSEKAEQAKRAFVHYLSYDFRGGYGLLFWAMMVLAVDKTDGNKHLTAICDWARILQITNEELMDLFKVVQLIFYRSDYKSTVFTSKKVPKLFADLIAAYR